MIPAGITTATVHLDAPISFTGEPGRLHVVIEPSVSLIWTETGTPLGSFVDTYSLNPGKELSVELPHTDQPGFEDGFGNTFTGWYYTATVVYEKDGRRIDFPPRDFQIPSGQVEVDLALVPAGDAEPVPAIAPILPVTSLAGLTGEVTAAELDTILGPLPSLVAKVNGVDRGETYLGKLRTRSANINIGIAGDSTWNAVDEAADLYMAQVAAENPNWAVGIPHWNDTTQAYNAETVLSTGIPDIAGVTFHDTFSRTAADIYNTAPDLGSVWSRDGSNQAGDWTLDGARAVKTADTTTGISLADAAITGDQRVTLSGVLSSTTTGVQRNFRVYFNYISSADHLYLQISVSTTGLAAITLVKRIAGTVTTLATMASPSSIIPSNTAQVPYTITVEKSGTAVSATVNGTTINGVLSGAESTALAPSTLSGFSGGVLAGDWVEEYKVEILTPAAPKKITLYNASHPGSVLSYHQSRVAQMFPVPLDLLLINSGHNYGAQTPAQYEAALDAFIAAFRAVQPTAAIVISSQNPQKSPAANRLPHLARQVALKSYAARRGYGYIAGLEAFTSRPDGGVSLVADDGVHPTPNANGGSGVWRDSIAGYFGTLGRWKPIDRIDNTNDLEKPLSTAATAALNLKLNTSTADRKYMPVIVVGSYYGSFGAGDDQLAYANALDAAMQQGGGIVVSPVTPNYTPKVSQLVIPKHVHFTGGAWNTFGRSGSMGRIQQLPGVNDDTIVFNNDTIDQYGATRPFVGPFGISNINFSKPAGGGGHHIHIRTQDGRQGTLQDFTTLRNLGFRGGSGSGIYIRGGSPINIMDLAGIGLGGYVLEIIDGREDLVHGRVHQLVAERISGDACMGYVDDGGGAVVYLKSTMSHTTQVFRDIKGEYRRRYASDGGDDVKMGAKHALILDSCESVVTVSGVGHIATGDTATNPQPKRPGAAILIKGTTRPKLKFEGVNVRVTAAQTEGAMPGTVRDEVSATPVDVPLSVGSGSYGTTIDSRELAASSNGTKWIKGVPGQVMPSIASPADSLGGATPVRSFWESDADLDEKLWSLVASGGNFSIRTHLDDGQPGVMVMEMIRNGTDVTEVKFAKKITGTEVESTAATGGYILKAPGGTRFRLTVGDDGALTTTAL